MPQPNSLTTRIPNGVTNCDPWQAMAQSGIPDPSFSQLFHEEFNIWRAGDWTTTLTGTGTTAATAGQGGWVLDTTTAATLDANFHQLPTAGFQLISGTNHFFKCRLQVSDATNTTVYAGLISTSTTPLTANDGLYFLKANAQTGWVLRHRIGGVNTDTALPALDVAAANTFMELSFHVDQYGAVEVFFNPTTGVFTMANATTGRGRVALLPMQTGGLTQVLLSPSFGIRSETATAKTMTTDYITVSSEI